MIQYDWIWLNKTFTVVALEWFFTSVKPFIHSQFVILYKSPVTVVAIEWFFTSVKPFMHSQVIILYKSLATVVAIEWFFTRVKPFMYSQVVILYKSHVTVVALQWFFSTWLNFTDWMSDLNGNKFMHASKQHIVIKKRTTRSHRNPRFFVHYWELSTTGSFY